MIMVNLNHGGTVWPLFFEQYVAYYYSKIQHKMSELLHKFIILTNISSANIQFNQFECFLTKNTRETHWVTMRDASLNNA